MSQGCSEFLRIKYGERVSQASTLYKSFCVQSVGQMYVMECRYKKWTFLVSDSINLIMWLVWNFVERLPNDILDNYDTIFLLLLQALPSV